MPVFFMRFFNYIQFPSFDKLRGLLYHSTKNVEKRLSKYKLNCKVIHVPTKHNKFRQRGFGTMNLKQLRKKRNMTQQELAEESGVLQQTISNIERGVVENVTYQTFSRLKNVLGDDLVLENKDGEKVDRRSQIETIRRGLF